MMRATARVEFDDCRQKSNAAKKNVNVGNANLALWIACRDGVLSLNDANMMSVQVAIAAGADVNYSLDGLSCLSIAASKHYHKIIELFITAGADKEAKTQTGVTALIIAAQNGHNKCIEYLLNAGCDVNALAADKRRVKAAAAAAEEAAAAAAALQIEEDKTRCAIAAVAAAEATAAADRKAVAEAERRNKTAAMAAAAVNDTRRAAAAID
jgi:ankyrin repeat protein